MNTQQKPVLLELEDLGGDEWAIRYKCSDSDLWYQIKETIMDADRDERRWDPDACNGRGAWIVSGCVLDDLKGYFPSINAWIAKSTASSSTPAEKKPLDSIDEVPF